MDAWAMFDAEREALCGDLADLRVDQWDAQSLCAEWKVRHVVAHLVAECDRRTAPMLVGVIRSGMSPNRYIAREALDAGEASPDTLLAALRGTVGTHRGPPMAKPIAMVSDTVCHSGDIRRPLGITRTAPEVVLLEVADNLKGANFPLGTRKRIAGLRLTATDADWSTGDGPVVEGPLESLVLVMAGRSAVLEDLSGEGIAVLAPRL